MAKTAKKETAENEVMVETEAVIKKETKTDKNVEKKIAEFDAQTAEIEALKAQLKQMQDMFAAVMAGQINSNIASQPKTNSLDEEVKIVHLVERAPGLSTHIELTNLTMDMNVFGEERTLDRRQCEELVGKYRKWFDMGIIAFGDGYDELAKKFQVKVVKSYDFNRSDFVQRLGVLKPSELEDLYMKLGDGHKAFIIEYFKRKIVEKDPRFMDVHKIELLNRLSQGAMRNTIDEVQKAEK